MADELMIQTRILFEKGDVKVSQGPTTLVLDVAGTDAIRATQEIGFAAAEAINKGEITTPGYMWVRNVVKLKAGEEALFRLAQTTPQAQADTAAVRIEYIIIED
jgi:hypothetical protein